MRTSPATRGPPWSPSCLPRGTMLLVGEALPPAWLGCLWAPGSIWRGRPCPLLEPPHPLLPRDPAPGVPPFLTAVMPAWSRVGMPPVPPSPSAMRPAPGRLLGALIGPALLRCMPPLVRTGRSVSAHRRGGPLLPRPSLLLWLRPRLQSAPMPTCRMLHPRSMPGYALLLLRRVLGSAMLSMRRESWLPRLRLSCAALLTLGALRLMLRPPRLMRMPLMPPLKPRLRLLLPLGPSLLRLRLRLRLLPPLRPLLRRLPLVPLWPAMSLLLPLPGRARASAARRSSKGGKDGKGGEAVARRTFVESTFAQAHAGATLDGRGLAAPDYADDADDSAGSDG